MINTILLGRNRLIKAIKKNKKQIISVGALIIFSLVLLKVQTENNNRLINKGNFTIGKITKRKAMKGGIIYYYTFKISRQTYRAEQKTGRNGEVGQKFYVIFDPHDPEKSRLLMNMPVPDSITETPINGWKGLPIDIDDEDKVIKKGFR